MASTDLKPPPSLGRALNYAAGGVNAMCNAILAEHDLSLPQWVILSALWRRDGLLVSELAEYSGNNGPAASRILDRMEEKGLLGRAADTDDRRAVRVVLTEKGQSLRHLAGFWQEVNARLLQGISEQDAVRLLVLLDQIKRNAREAAAPASKTA